MQKYKIYIVCNMHSNFCRAQVIANPDLVLLVMRLLPFEKNNLFFISWLKKEKRIINFEESL